MANKIAQEPKLSINGNATVAARVPVELRNSLIAIATRRGLTLNAVAERAFTQYVKADARRVR